MAGKFEWRKLIKRETVNIQGVAVERKTYKTGYKKYTIHHRILSYG